jgi:hypothetical protein
VAPKRAKCRARSRRSIASVSFGNWISLQLRRLMATTRNGWPCRRQMEVAFSQSQSARSREGGLLSARTTALSLSGVSMDTPRARDYGGAQERFWRIKGERGVGNSGRHELGSRTKPLCGSPRTAAIRGARIVRGRVVAPF